jgi:hypothetical protein
MWLSRLTVEIRPASGLVGGINQRQSLETLSPAPPRKEIKKIWPETSPDFACVKYGEDQRNYKRVLERKTPLSGNYRGAATNSKIINDHYEAKH